MIIRLGDDSADVTDVQISSGTVGATISPDHDRK